MDTYSTSNCSEPGMNDGIESLPGAKARRTSRPCPTSVRTLFHERLTHSVGQTASKRKHSTDSYLDISGLSALSAGDSIQNDSGSHDLVAAKRKLLDDRISSNFLRNAGIRRRYYELEAKRLALSSIGEESPDARLPTEPRLATLGSLVAVSPRRAYHERKRTEMRRKNDGYRQKYRELQEKRDRLGPLASDASSSPTFDVGLFAPNTSLPATLDRADNDRVGVPDLTSSTGIATPLSGAGHLTRRMSLPRRTRHRCDSKPTYDSAKTPRAPPRRNRKNRSYAAGGDVTADGREAMLSTFATAKGATLPPLTSSTSMKNSRVITVRFSYTYTIDGKLYTNF